MKTLTLIVLSILSLVSFTSASHQPVATHTPYYKAYPTLCSDKNCMYFIDGKRQTVPNSFVPTVNSTWKSNMLAAQKRKAYEEELKRLARKKANDQYKAAVSKLTPREQMIINNNRN